MRVELPPPDGWDLGPELRADANNPPGPDPQPPECPDGEALMLDPATRRRVDVLRNPESKFAPYLYLTTLKS